MTTTTFSEGGTTYTINFLFNTPSVGGMEIRMSPHPTAARANDWTLHIGTDTLAFSSATRAGDNFNWIDTTNFGTSTPFTDGAVLAAKITKTATNTLPTASNGTVITDEDTAYAFSAADFNFMDTDPGDVFSIVVILTLPASDKGTLALSGTAVTANQEIMVADIPSLTYTPPTNANGAGYASFTFAVADGRGGLSNADYTMTINVTAVNDLPSGKPTITGVARVGQTLTSDTNDISDADELTGVSYAYQWIRVATDNTETNISMATSSTYTLVTDDVGKTIKVKVSFTDDASNPETRTSVATATVTALNTAPTASNGTVVATAEDTDLHVLRGKLQFLGHRRRHALKRTDCYASGFGQGDPGALGHGCDREPGGSGGNHTQSYLHPSRKRERRWLREFHLQGERRHGRQRRRVHDDHKRDRG